MKKSEKLLAMEQTNEAMDKLVGPNIKLLSDDRLLGIHETLWATTQDFEHEWVRRQMLAEGKQELE